jgi:hypothetical protein
MQDSLPAVRDEDGTSHIDLSATYTDPLGLGVDLTGAQLLAVAAGKPVVMTLPSKVHSDFPEASADATPSEILEMKREDIRQARAHGFRHRARRDERRLARYTRGIRHVPALDASVSVARARVRRAAPSSGRPRAQATRSSSRSADPPDPGDLDDGPSPGLTLAQRRAVRAFGCERCPFCGAALLFHNGRLACPDRDCRRWTA